MTATTYGTLPTLAVHPVRVRIVRRGATTGNEGGFVASRTLRENVGRNTTRPQTRVWELTFGPDGWTDLLAAFDAAKGGALPVAWTPPPPFEAETDLPVRFVDGTLREVRRPGGLFSASVQLEEVC